MELLTLFIDVVLHLDTHLLALTQEYGMWVYGILFLIIFCETGLVVTVPPFINQGEKIRVSTADGEYLERA